MPRHSEGEDTVMLTQTSESTGRANVPKFTFGTPLIRRCLLLVSILGACALIVGLSVHFLDKGSDQTRTVTSEMNELIKLVANMTESEKSAHYSKVLQSLSGHSAGVDPDQTMRDVHKANILTLTDWSSCNRSSHGGDSGGGGGGGGGEGPVIPSFGGGSKTKEVFFHDLDYSLFGYDILKGFPLSSGRDPGYTLPIFKVNYHDGLKSADCRYSIPKGLVIVPMTSCITSFSSRLVSNKHEFIDILSVSLGFNAKAPSFGFYFNLEFRNMLQTLENKTRVYIMSTANCDYFFSKLVPLDMPDYSEDFLLWVERLEKSPTRETYMRFFDTYGTHTFSETIFGAKYIYQYSMDTYEYERKKQHNVSFTLGASYTSAALSAGGGISVATSQTDIIRQFLNNTDVKSIVVGATPKRNPSTWAEEVKKDPVPTYYKLLAMEELFTENYMLNVKQDLVKIRQNIIKYKYHYQAYLKAKCRGFQQNFLPISNTKLENPHFTEVETHARCMDDCLIDEQCLGITKRGKECTIHYGEGSDNHLTAGYDKNSQAYIMMRTVNQTIQIKFTKVVGQAHRVTINTSLRECIDMCFLLNRCTAVSHHTRNNECSLYQSWAIQSLQRNDDMTTYLAVKCSRFGA